MKSIILRLFALLFASSLMAQTGHILQGIGAKNLSMGGAATGNPIDISGAIHWNPAALSNFETNQLKIDVGFFFSAPELSSTVPTQQGIFSGTTADDRGVSVMPNIAYTWGKEGSKSRFAVSAFGISGFGVTFPESTTNPINMPQNMGGFGRIQSDYALLQMALTWSYKITDKLSFGIAPSLNYATLELMPNPTANPTQAGYPSTNKASTIGIGGHFALFYDSKTGFTSGVSYKSTTNFKAFNFNNTYLDNSTSTNSFDIDYPAILSLGIGYSKEKFDVALDYRSINYENTNGFNGSGWTQTYSVAGFGWKNVSVISLGVQYKGFENLPLRVGYTYSSNPINSDVAFFNIPATAIIKNAYQFGFSRRFGERVELDFVYHHGTSSGDTSGPVNNPMMISGTNPYGAIPGSQVSYNMTTDMIMFGFSYDF
ncbi:MAG: outer membrane protein transport protein [Flavobacteriaceae bacterium]|nr:outer membrane protein transport protein [Flavobacteriaceae bacterium]